MKKIFIRIRKFLWRTILWFLIISLLSVIAFKWIPVPVTPIMLINCVEQKLDGQEMRLDKTWKSLEEISPSLQLAMVCCEDQNFLKHNGFDIDAIKKALQHNEKSKRKRGASTISQQVAKNVFLWKGRTWVRKGFEVYFTFLIELFWSKQRIMEVYLNIIELGNGIYGAEAAAQNYFKKPALKLSKYQCASLAVIAPSPLKYKVNSPGPYIQKRINWTLRQMNNWGGKLKYED